MKKINLMKQVQTCITWMKHIYSAFQNQIGLDFEELK